MKAKVIAEVIANMKGKIYGKLISQLSTYRWLLLLVSLISPSIAISAAPDTDDVWSKLKNAEVVALMRHALAPGNGDPSEFVLGDCTTQRNLSEQGRLQARAIGKLIRDNGIPHIQSYSSQWCRCIDTATELAPDTLQELPLLNSFYQDRSTADTQTEQLRTWILQRLDKEHALANSTASDNLPAVLVSHQVNITALTGVYPTSGEIVFVGVENGELTVVSRVVTEY